MKKLIKKTLLSLILISTSACSNGGNMYSINELKQMLDFDCVIEQKPTIPKETEALYNYAHYQDLHRLWTGKAGDWNDLAKYYRIAAANGNYKANGRLQYLLYSNRIIAENNKKEVFELNEKLEKILPATAYFGYYFYLKKGYGVKTILMGELSYLRRAADLGSRDAQYIIAELLRKVKDKKSLAIRREIWVKLFKCSSEQGNKDSSIPLALDYQIDGKYTEAVKIFHEGVKNGSGKATNFLMRAFESVIPENNPLYYLGIKTADSERAIRYEMIKTYLSRNEFLDPKVPDLDEIVPLPPAKLPAWDGKIAFQRWFEGPSPEKPSDELMKKLAEKAGLDWQTGLPLKK